MSDKELLEIVAEQYRKDGYVVHLRPSPGQLPSFLKDEGIDLVADKGTEHIAVQVKRRGQLYEVNPPLKSKAPSEPGWAYEIVVYPPEALGESPRNGRKQDPGYTAMLIAEAEKLMHTGALRAAFVIAWSAAEAAMRETALREGVNTDPATPRFLVKSLYSGGVISRQDFETINEQLNVRNELVHGFEPNNLPADSVKFLVDFARRMQSEPAGKSDS